MNPETIRKLAAEIGEVTALKNEAYGDSFATSGDALRLLFPDGIPLEKYGDALLIARVWDKLGRIAHAPDAFKEDPYRDIAGYGLVAAAGRRESDAGPGATPVYTPDEVESLLGANRAGPDPCPWYAP